MSPLRLPFLRLIEGKEVVFDDPSPFEESDQDGTPEAKILYKLKDTIPTLIDA